MLNNITRTCRVHVLVPNNLEQCNRMPGFMFFWSRASGHVYIVLGIFQDGRDAAGFEPTADQLVKVARDTSAAIMKNPPVAADIEKYHTIVCSEPKNVPHFTFIQIGTAEF